MQLAVSDNAQQRQRKQHRLAASACWILLALTMRWLPHCVAVAMSRGLVEEVFLMRRFPGQTHQRM